METVETFLQQARSARAEADTGVSVSQRAELELIAQEWETLAKAWTSFERESQKGPRS